MKYLGTTAALGLVALSLNAHEVKDLGAGREVMWDMDRISALGGGAKLTLHHPQLREVSLVHDAPWEGNVCCYDTVLHDDVNYKLYYRGSAHLMPGVTNHEVICYAESDDGIHWRKPNLGICKYNGSTENNIIFLPNGKRVEHNFSPFFDRNPACPKDEKYKGLGGLRGRGLFGYTSSDGIHWKIMGDKPLLTKGWFDSQNIAFWDEKRGCYIAYYRMFFKDADGVDRRRVQVSTSSDFRTWSDPKWLTYDADSPEDELYTNAISPYDRAPGIYVGFPKRFTAGRRCTVYDRVGRCGTPGSSDGVFMSSRDGYCFKRWGEAFLRPGLQQERWISRNNMTATGYVLTKSEIPGCPDEISLYSTENYYSYAPNRLRRMTIRLDGFVSVNAPYRGGTVTTKPLTFSASDGKETRLLLNASTSGAGFLRCEIRDESGRSYPGYSLEDSVEVYGDLIELPMAWKSGADVSSLAGKTVVLHFSMKDADIFSYHFGK